MVSKNNLPYAESYWVVPGKIIAGEYPGTSEEEKTRKRIQALLKSGVRTFIDLTKPGDSYHPYQTLLYHEAEEFGFDVTWKNYPIPDLGVPSNAQMVEVLDEIDLAVYQDKMPYIHCIAGIGRTGTVVGCYLIRHGCPVNAVLMQIAELRKDVPTWWCTSPEVNVQLQFVLGWQERM